ncbi:HlyD family efflux transporter periplasmic adaptor subunit [Amygdalobacter nucleatus]|uniref:Uncharacterized protein n=1 Tax=Amygdalobacter nucleatus TaxID=3029274 RepID=A0A133YFK5_9FIRM|nr:HlyD family efflux transporter periplasmic adaptor subunit [Amygdalobacter nucleatus]KXB41981.1 hypothetical protein HMPREF1872_00453 [Amygdalobacter nucleatus]MDF0485640.1 HlyD family efflux transporter periplasmic adaptor subunit [Amygdalobacter nucleatus]
MAIGKKNKRFKAIQNLANSLQAKLSNKQAQIEQDVAKQDALRLEDYLYEQGQVNSSALAKRKMQERRGFKAFEREFYSGYPQSNYPKQQVTNYKPETKNPVRLAETMGVTGQLTSDSSKKKHTIKDRLDGFFQRFAKAKNKRQQMAKKQPALVQTVNKQSNSKAWQPPVPNLQSRQATYMPEQMQNLQTASANIGASPKALSKQPTKPNKFTDQIFKLFYTIVAIFMKPKKLDLSKQNAEEPATSGKLPKYDLADVNRKIDSAIFKMQRQEKRRRLITVFCFSFSLLLLAIVIGKVILNQTSAKMELHILKNGDLEQQFPAFGFVAREEKVLYSPVAGEIEAIKAEGSLVAADEEIANIVTSDISEIKHKNDNIERQISEQILTLLKRGQNTQANQLFAKADVAMLPTLNLLRQDLAENKLGHINNYVYTLQPFLQERNFSLRQMNLADPIIDSLRTEQKVLVHELQEKARIIETPSAGLISYKINPQLIDINTETIQSMSYDQFITYYNAAKPSASSNGKKVKEQVPVIRLVDTRYQYFLLQVANAKSSDFTVNKAYKLLVAGVGQTIENCTVLRVTPDNGGVLLLLKSDRNVEVLLDQVAIKAKLIKATKSGLIVPKVALVYEDAKRESTAYVEVLKGGFVEKVSVRVVDSNEQYAIIEGLNEKDNVISENAIVVLNPRQVKVGQQVT